MQPELLRLHRQVRRLNLAVVILGGTLVVVMGAAFSAQHSNLIRTRGIIVEDSEGRPRILIGAPTPVVAERLRTNPERYEEAFGLTLGTHAAGVGNLRNDAYGVLILDERGHDRVALGSPVPDPLNGRRIGAASGLSFHNQNGVERGGIGHMSNAETGLDRSILGLDGPEGEGALLVADSDGTNGLVVMDPQNGRMMFAGRSRPGGLLSEKDDRVRLGLTTRDADQSGTYVGAEAATGEVIRPPTP